ncbi:hypothetical protein HN415_01875 [Candidatus Woesearchaeota archaeon]|nr:hypothetical protein [Candidatus Woesearchaeota archaeon]
MLERPVYNGLITSQGGNVTNVGISPTASTNWRGIYGNLSNLSSMRLISYTSFDQEIKSQDLNLWECYDTEIYASTLNSISWAFVEPALPSDIDNFLSISNASPISGTNVFTTIKNFSVNGRLMPLYSTTTRSNSGEYDLGILKQGSYLIFVTHPSSLAISFNDVKADFQMMFPKLLGVDITYNFFNDPWDSATCGIFEIPNSAPSLTLGDISGYFGQELEVTFSAIDPENDWLTLISRPYLDFINIQFVYNRQTNEFDGIIRYTPRIKGDWHTNFVLSDGINEISQRVEFSVAWCGNTDSAGNPRCDSRYETCETCAQDCGACGDNLENFVIISNYTQCKGKPIILNTYERYKPNVCSTKSIIDGVEVCNSVSNVEINLFNLINQEFSHEETLINQIDETVYVPSENEDTDAFETMYHENVWNNNGSFVTSNDGQLSFMIDELGEYKIIGKRSGYHDSFLYIDVEDCPEPIIEEIILPITGKVVENASKEPLVEEPKVISGAWEPEVWLLVSYNAVIIICAMIFISWIHKKK